VRIVFASVAVAAAIWCWVDYRYGDIAFDWIKAFASSLLAGLAFMVLSALQLFIPPRITVSPRGISRGYILLPYRSLASATVTRARTPALVVRVGTRTLEYVVSQEVDLDALEKLLELHMRGKAGEAESS
jgi:hypothetical protein